MSLAAGSGDQLPMCLEDADDELSISLAGGGGSDRFSFLTEDTTANCTVAVIWGCHSVT